MLLVVNVVVGLVLTRHMDMFVVIASVIIEIRSGVPSSLPLLTVAHIEDG